MRRILFLTCLTACAPPDRVGPDAFTGPPDGGTIDATVESAEALFQLTAPEDYYALPFPNDLRVRPDGTLDLDDHPRPNPLLARYFDLFDRSFQGFGTNSAVFFRFSGWVREATLPADPAASMEEGASVYLVDVDPDSPERGRRVPLRFRFERWAGEVIGDHWLAALPYPGFPLRPSTTYAAVVTTRVEATDLTPVGRSPDFEAVIAGAEPASPEVARAREVYAPLLAWLDEAGGDERADVASAAVFTTQDPTALMGRVREVIYRDVPEPQVRDVRYLATYPSFTLYQGEYDSPNFQTGEPPYNDPEDGGEIVLDEQGYPIIQRMEPIRFAVSMPAGDMPEDGWPVVLYAHGTGGYYLSFLADGTAERMAAEGLAVISIDQVLHGPRNPNGGSVELAFFNFNNPAAARDNVRQGALDDFQLVRVARNLVIAPRHPGARVHRIDPGRVYFMGHSQGGLTGPPFLAYEPLVHGAVLSGAGGLIYLSLLEKTEPVDITAVIGTFIRDNPLDEFNPVLALVQMYIDPADPTNYARLLVAEPPPGSEPKDIYQSEGLIDHFTPPVNIEAFGVAMGLSPVAPELQDVPGFALRGLDWLEPPVTANLNGRTAVFLQYEAPSNSDGHFVVFDVPAAERQHAAFLGTLAREGRAVLVP